MFGPHGKWDDERESLLVDINQIKILYSSGYNIETELTFKPKQEIDNYIAFLAEDQKIELHFEDGQLKNILYFHDPVKRDKIYLSINFYEKIITRLFERDEYTGEWLFEVDCCQDNNGRFADAEDWLEKYWNILCSDIEPYRQKLKDILHFDILDENFWDDMT